MNDKTWVYKTVTEPGLHVLESADGCVIRATQNLFVGTGSDLDESAYILETIANDGVTDPADRTVVGVPGLEGPIEFLGTDGTTVVDGVDKDAWVLSRVVANQGVVFGYSLICPESAGTTDEDFEATLQLFTVRGVAHAGLD